VAGVNWDISWQQIELAAKEEDSGAVVLETPEIRGRPI